MRSKSLPLISWAFYDFANTIFSAVVLTAYFPLYLTEKAGANWYLGAATTGSMIAAGIATPFMGALSDQTGKTKLYLIQTTLTCIAFLFLLSIFKSPWALILVFIVSCFFYHAALVFYNSLLTIVAAPEKQGFASGLGTGLGYLGVVFALPIANLADQHLGHASVFMVAAILFLFFSLPAFFFVPERKVAQPVRFSWNLGSSEWKKIAATIRTLPRRPKLLLFFGGNFFVVDALNSAIFWLSVFTREVFHPGQNAIISFLIALNATAFLAGILTGFLTDRFGAMKTMILSAVSLALTLATLASVPNFTSFIILTLTGGSFAIAGIWTAGRKVLIDLVEPEKLGEYFGLYGLTTKISVIGSFAFSIVADVAGFRPALWVLVFPSAAGSILLFISGKFRKD